MPTLKIEGKGSFEIPTGTRLVNALKEKGGEPLYRCSGNARCTTCRVEFLNGEPEKMTQAEKDKLESGKNLGKFRLSCQCLVEEDMHVKVLMPFSESKLDDPGSGLADEIHPQPVVWTRN
ncbi:MAG: (2Fe-2S)-binding protein [Anaerolineae bacterium]|nr:(2Fe-2S)-binding protein [Anaerolineae bacterium]MBT7783408.1 (2Fe-2S)-binding protein [Anaerolineae bacterium]